MNVLLAALFTTVSVAHSFATDVHEAIAKAKVPTPVVQIQLRDCPAMRGYDCYDMETNTIYLRPVKTWWRAALYHELGHAWDWQNLTTADRAHLTVALGFRANRAWYSDRGPAERFADAYASCAFGKRNPDFYELKPAQFRLVCDLVRSR